MLFRSATSNRDMRQAVSNNAFREDLFYRLNVFPLHVSPLRERKDDIIPIAERLIEQYAISAGRSISELTSQAKGKLRNNHWQGNVRELDNVIQRSLILQSGDIIDSDDIQFEITSATYTTITSGVTDLQEQNDTLNGDLKQREWDLILNAIKDARGSRKVTAERLGVSQRTLRYKLARMRDAGIVVPGSNDMETVQN